MEAARTLFLRIGPPSRPSACQTGTWNGMGHPPETTGWKPVPHSNVAVGGVILRSARHLCRVSRPPNILTALLQARHERRVWRRKVRIIHHPLNSSCPPFARPTVEPAVSFVRFPRESRQDSSLTYMESAIRSDGGRTRQAMAGTAWWSYGTTERRCQEHREKRSATWLAQQHLKGPLCGPFG